MPIESFVTTLIHWTFFLMTRAKLAFVGFVAAGNSMWHQVLDDAKVSASLSQISPQRHATLPTHQTVPSTTPYVVWNDVWNDVRTTSRCKDYLAHAEFWVLCMVVGAVPASGRRSDIVSDVVPNNFCPSELAWLWGLILGGPSHLVSG